MNIPVLVISFALMLAGLAGIIIPVIPDTILIFAGALLYGIVTHFDKISPLFLLILAGLALLTNILDWLGAIYGATKYGATRWGILGAIFGGILGLILFSIFGLFIGAIAGTILAEIFISKKEYSQALKSGFGTFIGIMLGMVIKIIIAISMIGLFLLDLIK